MPVALNLLRDSNGYLPDREIARRLGVAHSTLCRQPMYKHARRVFIEPARKVVKKQQ
jgi:hypothetical protein